MKRAAWLALALTCAPAASLAQAPTAEQYYVRALEQMKQTHQPSQLRYTVTIDVENGSVTLRRGDNGMLQNSFQINDSRGKQHDSVTIVEDPVASTYRATLSDGDVMVSKITAFNPTWQGLYDWMRYGSGGAPDTAVASPQPDEDGTPVIAVVRAIGLANYRVTDSGATTCANGDAAHAVELTARGDALKHPLTYAAIDRKTDRFCSLRFNVPKHLSTGATATAYLQVDLGDVNGYYLITSEQIEAKAKMLGFNAGHMVAKIAFGDFDFSKH